MIEVFVAFVPGTEVGKLQETLEAWDLPGIEPVAVQVKQSKFGLFRCVTAENLSKGDYIVADLGFGPLEENFGEVAEKLLLDNQDAGLIAVSPINGASGNHVAICRKGIIKTWPQPSLEDKSYIGEHAEAYRLAGYKVSLCSTLHFHRLAVSSPC